MIEIDLDQETLDCLGMRRADEEQWFPPDWSAWKKSVAAEARRKKRERECECAAIIKAAKEAGCSRVTVYGVTYEFGEADAPKATLTPLEAWKAKHARSA
jgi:hypothetical protein